MFKKIFSIVLLALSFLGCTTISYYGDTRYVGFYSDEGLKSSKQKSAVSGDNMSLQNTFDDQYFYDGEGRLTRHIQTEHINDGDRALFIEWQIQYEVIAGHSVPKSVAVNGTVYLEVEYTLLPVKASGIINPQTVNPHFFALVKVLLEKKVETWDIGLDNFPVPFKTDDKFVTTKEDFSFYGGIKLNNYLSLGYDNIVLKRFFYSRDALSKGLTKSLQKGLSNPINSSQKNNWEFLMDWEVKAEKVIQTKMNVNRNFYDEYLVFEATRKFDEAGRRVEELWTVTDQTREKLQPVVLFEQKLSY